MNNLCNSCQYLKVVKSEQTTRGLYKHHLSEKIELVDHSICTEWFKYDVRVGNNISSCDFYKLKAKEKLDK